MTESVQRWQKEQGMVDDITIILAYLRIDPSKQFANQKKQQQSSNQHDELIDNASALIEQNSKNIAQNMNVDTKIIDE